MLKALSNVAPRHLLDTRLNPPAALRATVRRSEPVKKCLTAEIAEIAETRIPKDSLRTLRSPR
jgi:hypothetical protein